MEPESSAVEVDGVDESGDASEAVGLPLDGLDLGVDAFGSGVGHAVADGVEDAGEVVSQALGRVFHGFELAFCGPFVPVLKVPAGASSVAGVPQPLELFLDGPGGVMVLTPQEGHVEPVFLGFGKTLPAPGASARGLVGSRSARHARQNPGLRSLVLGPLTGLQGRGTQRPVTEPSERCPCGWPTGRAGRRCPSCRRETRGPSHPQAPWDR